jgi:hypothetical protein
VKISILAFLAALFGYLALFAVLMVLLAPFEACTIAPKPVAPTQAPFEGDSALGGVLARLPDGGYEITQAKVIAYDGLIAKGYGKAWIPALGPNDGVKLLPDGNFEIDDQHLVDFAAMAARFRRGEKP